MLKQLNDSYIFGVVFVINFSWGKAYIYIFFENRVMHTRRFG